MSSPFKTAASHVSGPAVSGTQHNFRTGSVDSQMTSLSGGSELTNASQTISNDGINDAVRIGGAGGGGPGGFNVSFAGNQSFGDRSSMHGGDNKAMKRAGGRRADLGGAGGAAHGGAGSNPDIGTGQVPVCTLCDQASSDFSCRACGGLTFCEKCALSLHTNKFLGNHSLQNILDPKDTVLGSDLAIRRATMDAERAAKEIYSDEARRARMAEEEAQLQDELRIAAASGRDRAREEEERRQQEEKEAVAKGPRLDMRALAADRSVLNARSKELRSCIDILRRLGVRLSEEQASCVDATRTAGDAIRKKFDLLRNLINQKESAFLAVVQDAGKMRHDAGAAQRTAVAAAVAETTAFVDNLDLQMQRLEGNHLMFNDARAGLMEDTRTKISTVDGHIHKFEGVVQEVKEIPLGVVVPIEGIVTALQMLQPPERTIGSSEVAMLNAADALLPVPADAFENQLGVKHFRSVAADDGVGIEKNEQHQQQMQQSQRSSGGGGGGPSSTLGGSTTRSQQSYRSNSPMMNSSRMQQQQQQQSSNVVRSSSNFAIREVQRTSSPLRGSVPRGSNPSQGASIPPEVRELRRALNSSSRGSGGGGGTPQRVMTPTRGRVDSPMRSGSTSYNIPTPTGGPARTGSRTGSPMRSGQQQPQFSGRVGGVTPGGNPGLGQPAVSWPTASRGGNVGTPPRQQHWRM